MQELYADMHLNDEMEPKTKVDEDIVRDLQRKYHSAKTQNEVRVVFLYIFDKNVQTC